MATSTAQLPRRKGWRKEVDGVVVARPGPWGNPFRIGWWFRVGTLTAHEKAKPDTVAITPAIAVAAYEQWVRESKNPKAAWIRDHVHELAGRTLYCWCSLGAPCHRDVLARMADEAAP